MHHKQKEIEQNLIKSIQNKENVTKERLEQAEEIDFKAIPDKIYQTDEYGFIQPSLEKEKEKDSSEKQKELLKNNARVEKWNAMLSQYEVYTTSKFSKLKSRTRKGIPDSLRGYVWQQFAGVSKFFVPNLYQKLSEDKEIDKETETVILKDLDRTFPKNLHFQDKYGAGQRALYHVLASYSKYNKETGYVQGMGFIVALLLTYMDQESSFFFLHSLMKNYDLEGFYLPNFPSLKRTFYVMLNLMKKFIPKIYETLRKEGLLPSMYASEWFITVFTRELDFKILVRIFDVFLLEGFKIIYRFSLAFMKLKENEIINEKGGIAGLMPILKNIFEGVETENLFEVAFGFSMTREFIKKCESEYEKVKGDEKNEFVSQL